MLQRVAFELIWLGWLGDSTGSAFADLADLAPLLAGGQALDGVGGGRFGVFGPGFWLP